MKSVGLWRFLFLSKCKSPKQNVVCMALFLMTIRLPDSKAGFVEVPLNQTLTYPSEMVDASFRCRYEPQVHIIWLVNGTQFRSYSQSGIESTVINHDNESATEILTIPNNPRYNGTQVVCVAYPDAPREATPVATLIIITDNETEKINSTSNQFPSPMLMVVTLDGQHTYKCSHPTADRISWRVNNQVLGADILTIPGIEYTDTISHPGDAIYTLRIKALPQNNETAIQCTAAFLNGSQISLVVTFLIQGLLQGVCTIERNVSTLSWMPPYSLNLTGVDPDIVYCVEVYNITCGRRDLIISNCNVTEPSYTSDDMAPIGYIYEYTVTPRSNVEGASNGTSITVAEEYVTLKSLKQNQLSMMGRSEIILTIYADIHNEQAFAENKFFAKSYSMFLISLDGQNDDDETKHLPNIIDMRNKSLVMFRVPLPFRRLWNYTVLAYGCDEHPLTNSTLLSTHDMQDISITSPSAGTIWINGNFIPDLPAIGIVVVVLNTSEISYHLLRREGNQLGNEGILSNIRGGEHMVSVFVVDRTGLPFNRAATIPQNVVVNGHVNQSFPIEYEVKSTSTGVCVICTFLYSSTTGCVAVVHQRISQLSSSGLMNIESSHKFNRSGDTAYGCIEGIEVSRHQVGVIDGSRKQPPVAPTKPSPDSCSTLCQAIVVTVATVSLVLSIILFILTISVYIGRKRQKVRLLQRTAIHVSDDVLESDARYETVQLRIQCGHTRAEVDASSTTDLPTVCDNDPTPKPVTLEHLLPELLPLASKWQSLGEALTLDEDQLDEIFTNNETDEACLEVMLEHYMARPYLNHSWEEIQKALKQIGEELTIDQPEVPPREKTETIHPELPSGEDLTEQQDTLDQEIASQKSESEKGVPTEDPPLHTEPKDNEDTCDASQQVSILSDNEHEDMNQDDYPSSFDEQANEPSESSNQDDGQFESGKGASPVSETASITSDNRNVYDTNKSELHRSNICAPLAFHTECEEQNNKEFCDVLAPRSGTCSWSESVDGTSELVISSNWHFLKQGKIVVHYYLHSKDA